jgi:hypothetical protein
MRSLTAGWETSRELAARPKLPSRTTARNTVMSSVWMVISKAYDSDEVFPV